MIIIFVWLITVIFCGLIGAMLASSKGHGFAGFFLGLIFGPIGIVIALLLPADVSTSSNVWSAQGAQSPARLTACPFCAELIQPKAVKCRYCASSLPESFRENYEKMLVSQVEVATQLPVIAAPIGWYYMKNGVKKGPVSEGDFIYLIDVGTVQSNDMVRRSDMVDWITGQEALASFKAQG